MEVNYIILAHKNPRQVRRLIEKLDGINCNFYLHVDKGADIAPFIEELSHLQKIHVLPDEKREATVWGDIGLIKATLNSLEQIVADGRNGFCALLSGQDYPIKSNEAIASFLTNNPQTNFISTFSIPSSRWANDGMKRLTLYKFNISNRRKHSVVLPSVFERNFYTLKSFKCILRLIRAGKFQFLKKIFKKRRMPAYIAPFGGEHWWTLPVETIGEILGFLKKHPDFYTYHKDTSLPEEIFFHSIVMHLAGHNPEMVIKPTLTYVNWERENVVLPVTFTGNDLDELKNQPENMLFARKFDIGVDEGILDLIDELELSRSENAL
ncbi:MAG: beta-1,6-N-acetylglucosaminyltransferase [Mucilaginibacter sp.]|jgi:hypothetical protein